jgi:tetraacyldisaccharide-1-P 4'-kinase
MKVIIDLPIHSLVLDANPLLLNALTQATIVSRDYAQGMRYVVEDREALNMIFMDDGEFQRTSLTKQAITKEGTRHE